MKNQVCGLVHSTLVIVPTSVTWSLALYSAANEWWPATTAVESATATRALRSLSMARDYTLDTLARLRFEPKSM